MSDLIDTTEMYLKTIYALQEEGVPALRARIVERLGQSGPTVSETVARLERDGLLVVGANREISFTDEGFERAAAVMRRHRLAERMLTDLLGMDVAMVHDEACRWEHAMSEAAADLIESNLGAPDTDPFGNPIPALTGHAVVPAAGDGDLVALQDVVDSVTESGQDVTVVLERIGEHVQTDGEALASFVRCGAKPGVELEVARGVAGVEIRAGDGCLLEVPQYVLHAVFVRVQRA